MATAEQYADWLVKNEAKKGTPEFDTVAAAYKQVRAAPAVPNASKAKGGVLGGMFMGLRDPIDAGAQLLARGVDAAVGGINSVTGLDLPRPDVAGVDKVVQTANAEYDASREMAGRDGIDVARVVGAVANPLNRMVPMAGARTAAGVAGRAAAQGGISGALTPVTDGDFAGTKAAQIGAGLALGGAAGYGMDKLAQGVSKQFAQMKAKPNGVVQRMLGEPGMPIEARVESILQRAAIDQQVDLSQIPKSIMDDVRGNVARGLSEGKNIDARALMRRAEGEAVLGPDAGLLLGQATRDPLQFAEELNLRGIQNAGKPIADRLSRQNERLIDAVGKRGARGAPDAYEAGAAAIKSLQAADKQMSQGVTDAYNAFRKAGGVDIDVPLQPLAQTLGDVIEMRGANNIPSAVKDALASYGLMGGEQTKVFNLLEADKLIKIINANIDPMKAPEFGALGQLRAGLNDSIELAAKQSDGATGPASELLRTALKTAKDRFALHEAVPALERAAERGNTQAQEAFVRTYITSKSAGIDTVDRLVKLLQPEALDGVRRNVLADILEKSAPGATRGSDAAKFSQAGYARALEAIGDRKLRLLFGDEGLSALRQTGRVAEWIQKQPAGSAVNNSNTAGAMMNLLQGMGGKLSGIPLVNIARDSVRQAVDERAAATALGAKVRPTNPNLSPEDVAALRLLLPNPGGALGVTAASGFGQ
jgi:hypothetical protein